MKKVRGERERARDGRRERPAGTGREDRGGKNTKYKKEITETGRQGGENEREWAGKDCSPTPHRPPPHVCIYQKNRQH